MAVTVSGMGASDRTFFADSPVVVAVQVTGWGRQSPFTIVRLEVRYDGRAVGRFQADTGGQTTMEFDISTALKAIWSDYDYQAEVASADAQAEGPLRAARAYTIEASSEYLDTDGELVTASSGEIEAGRCVRGGYTEWERRKIGSAEEGDVAWLTNTNFRSGNASTKPTAQPERVGIDSITSWTGVTPQGTQTYFYGPSVAGASDRTAPHPPLVLRDSVPYADFLFLNRRGAVESCSASALEAMQIENDIRQYSLIGRPAFVPSPSLTAIGTDGRRSWAMSSGRLSREWCEWWKTEFLGGKRKRWWMKYQGSYVPVIVEPAKKQVTIYDRSKQQMSSVEFTVTLALEG